MVLVLVSAGALDDTLGQYNFADLFSYVNNLFGLQLEKKTYSDLNHFCFLVVLCHLSQKDKQITFLKKLSKRFNCLVLFDHFLCDTTQLVHINRMTVNLPFSLLSNYISPIIICFISIIGSVQF